MTTEAAAREYLSEHLKVMEGRREVVYNPLNNPIDELPSIMCFCNSCAPQWHEAIAVSEDGVCLGGHICSDHGYILHDLGVIDDCRLDRHESSYTKHYPDGYKMEYIQPDQIKTHAKLQLAIDAANKRAVEKGE